MIESILYIHEPSVNLIRGIGGRPLGLPTAEGPCVRVSSSHRPCERRHSLNVRPPREIWKLQKYQHSGKLACVYWILPVWYFGS